jgi:hypothetical protein
MVWECVATSNQVFCRNIIDALARLTGTFVKWCLKKKRSKGLTPSSRITEGISFALPYSNYIRLKAGVPMVWWVA